ncbi:MAG: glycosyltransferase family 2 protein [Candidatus Loosdrechtia sp.]|uniref:glycosyltransferase family 2 protein n=1 Tax=Candidatus Loosdrechtia sp. TaxID=3101272 RepID=UPI003A77DCA9|nr:MAG: glycosyltransferase family 2 protein [Candidatus Jettenia sp. AMX2]
MGLCATKPYGIITVPNAFLLENYKLPNYKAIHKPIKIGRNELNLAPKGDNSPLANNQFATGQPLVSVIIPAYNAEAYIEQTLDSVLAQTYKNIEVIVTDDGSQDKTVQIVESIMQRDDRVTLLRQSNSGVAAARNLAIEKSRGEFIAPIDADDIWYPRKIEKQVDCMLHAGESTGLVYAWSVFIDKRGVLTGAFNASDIEGDVFLVLIFTNFIGHSSAPLIRRVCFKQLGGYSTRLLEQNAQGCEDRDLYLRIAEFYKFRVVKEFLVGYRKVDGSMSFNYKSMEKSNAIVIGDVRQRYPTIPSFVYRWSRSHYFLYLSHKSRSCTHYLASIFYLFKALQLSPVFFLYPTFLRTLSSCVLQLVKQATIYAIRKAYRSPAWPREKDCTFQKKLTLSDIIKKSSKPLSGLSRLHRNRLLRIQRLQSENGILGKDRFQRDMRP